MKSKKGIMSFDIIMLGLVRMVEYIFIFFILYAIVSMLITTKISTGATEGDIYVNRIIYSAAAFRDDETGRTYPGVLDEKKLDNNLLAKQMNGDIKIATSIKTEHKEAVFNERAYNYLLPLAESGIPGKSAALTETKINALVQNKDTKKNEEATFKTVSPK